MSENIENMDVTIDESTLDPKIVKYFEAKYTPLSDKNKELLGKYTGLKGDVESLGGMDAVRALKQKADDATAAAERERLEKLNKDGKLTEIEEHFKKLLADKDNQLKTRDERLVAKEVDLALNKAIRDHEGNPLFIAAHMKSRIEAALDENGDVKITVKGKSGESVNDKGVAYTLDDLVAEFKNDPDFGGAFAASGASGGGSRRSSQVTQTNNPFAKGTFNVTKQMEMIKDQPDIARKFAEAAGVKPSW